MNGIHPSPIHFALGPIQHLHTQEVRLTPVHTRLLGFPRVTCGIINTHPPNLRKRKREKVREKEGEREREKNRRKARGDKTTNRSISGGFKKICLFWSPKTTRQRNKTQHPPNNLMAPCPERESKRWVVFVLSELRVKIGEKQSAPDDMHSLPSGEGPDESNSDKSKPLCS